MKKVTDPVRAPRRNAHRNMIPLIRGKSKYEKRFQTLTPFIIESQRQHFESLKFSLNIWAVINSGMAIALISKNIELYFSNIAWLVFGSFSCGIGSIFMLAASKALNSAAQKYICDTSLKIESFLNSNKKINVKLYVVSSIFLCLSYFAFIYSLLCMLLNTLKSNI